MKKFIIIILLLPIVAAGFVFHMVRAAWHTGASGWRSVNNWIAR